MIFLLADTVSCLGQSWIGDSKSGFAQKVTLAVYLDFQTESAAILRAERIYTDYQRKGFFRIGVLPMVVVEGLRIELRAPTRLSAALTNVSARFAVRGNRRKIVEGRGFSLTFAWQPQAAVRAKIVRLESEETWNLGEGLVERPGEAPLSFRQATLVAAGPRAGELSCATTNGLVHLDLLSLTGQKHP